MNKAVMMNSFQELIKYQKDLQEQCIEYPVKITANLGPTRMDAINRLSILLNTSKTGVIRAAIDSLIDDIGNEIVYPTDK